MTLPDTGRAENATVEDGYERLARGFQSGKMLDELPALPKALAELAQEPAEKRVWSLARLHSWCLASLNATCERDTFSELGNAFGAAMGMAGIDPAAKMLLSSEFADHALRHALYYQDASSLKTLLPAAEKLNKEWANTRDFARTNATIASAHILLGDLKKAHFYSRRGWFFLLSNHRTTVEDFTDVLPEFMFLFQLTGQTQRAAAAEALVRQVALQLAQARPYHLLRVLSAEMTLQSALRNPRLVLIAARTEANILALLQFDPLVTTLMSISLRSIELVACIGLSGVDCDLPGGVSQLTGLLEQATKARAVTRTLPAVHTAATIAAFYFTAIGTAPPAIVREVLSADRVTIPGVERNTGEWVTMLGRALLERSVNADTARRKMAAAARAMLSELSAIQAASPLEATPLRIEELLAVDVAVAFLARSPEALDEADSSLLFQLMMLTNRTSRSIESQYGYASSLLPSQDMRLSLQNFYNLELAIGTEERAAINRISDIIEGKYHLEKAEIDFERLERFSQLDELQEGAGVAIEHLSTAIAASDSADMLREVQSRLAPNERFITHAVVFDRLVRFCFGASDVHVSLAQRDPTKELLAVKTVLAALTNPSAPDSDRDSQFPLSEASLLSDLVLGPGVECVRDATHLVVAPDPIFFRIPIHILIDPASQRIGRRNEASPPPFSSIPWLGVRRAISIVTDARQFVAARKVRMRAPAPLAFLGIGDPVLSTEPVGQKSRIALRGSNGQEIASVNELGELPQTGVELSRVAAVFGPTSKLLLRSDASEVNVRRQPLSDYRVIAFATHGLVREEVAGVSEPALVLTPRNRAIQFNDGILTASEISQFSLSADVVVLSACNSGRFDVGRLTNEAVGLSTSFLLAGARATVASMWSVDSQATEELMSGFAEAFTASSTIGASDALRQAMSRFLVTKELARFAHPRFWAAFTVFGDGAPRTTSSSPEEVRFRLLSSSESRQRWGETLQMTALLDGTRMLAGYDDVGRSRVRGVLRIRRAANARWSEHADDEFSFVLPIGSLLDRPSVLAWRSPAGRALQLELRHYDLRAKVVSRSAIDSMSDTFVGGVVALSATRFLVGSYTGSPDNHGVNFSIRVVDDRGRVARSRRFTLAPDVQVAVAALQPSARGGGWIVVKGVTGDYSKLGPPTRIGMIRVCSPQTQTLLFHVSEQLELTGDPILLQDVGVASVRPYGATTDVAAITLHDSCDYYHPRRSGVTLLQPGSAPKIFEADFGGGSHEGQAVLSLPQGGWLLLSRIERRFAGWGKGKSMQDGAHNPEDQVRMMDDSTQSGLLVTRFLESGKVADSWPLLVPGSMWVVDGLVETAGSALLVGSRNFAPFIGRFEIR